MDTHLRLVSPPTLSAGYISGGNDANV